MRRLFGLLVAIATLAPGPAWAEDLDAKEALGLAQDAFNAHEDEEALRWFRRAGFLGDAAGTYGEAYMVQYGRGTKADPAYARELYARAADQGSVHAAYQLGFMAHEGVGGPIDLTEARKQYQRAADLGDAQAMYSMGTLVWLETPDHAEGLRWFHKAEAAAGPADLPYVSQMYLYLGRAARDEHEAAAYFRKGADLRDPFACLELAEATRAGRGVPRDDDAAEALYAKAEGLLPRPEAIRLAPSTAWLGARALQRGDGATARHWLELGADGANGPATALLGQALHQGRWGAPNDERAEFYLLMAAEAGQVQAERTLVDLYRPGRPLARPIHAYKWAVLAAEDGGPMDWLVRWGLEASTSVADRQEGAAWAAEWRKTHPRTIPSPGHKTP